MDLILVRHGEPDIEAEDLSDPPLTPLGHAQARATADFLATAELDAIYVSPQLRAQQTVEPLSHRHSMEPVTDERIAEWDYGTGSYVPSWINDEMTREEAAQRFADMQTPAFYQRVKEGFDDIIDGHPGQTVAVVCHGGVIGSLVREILGASNTPISPFHASVSRVAANRRGMRSVISLNEHNWVPRSLP